MWPPGDAAGLLVLAPGFLFRDVVKLKYCGHDANGKLYALHAQSDSTRYHTGWEQRIK